MMEKENGTSYQEMPSKKSYESLSSEQRSMERETGNEEWPGVDYFQQPLVTFGHGGKEKTGTLKLIFIILLIVGVAFFLFLPTV